LLRVPTKQPTRIPDGPSVAEKWGAARRIVGGCRRGGAMNGKIRVIQYGIGAMGSNMVRLLAGKECVSLVGAIDIDEAKIGCDAGRLAGLGRDLGITVQFPPEEVLDRVQADVVLHATTAFMKDAYPLVTKVLERGMNVVTIAQELFFPLGENAHIAKDIDALAKEKGVSITAVGINPGFILDFVPIVGSLP